MQPLHYKVHYYYIIIIIKSAVSVARGIYEVYCRQGAPVYIISDQECSNEKKDFVH